MVGRVGIEPTTGRLKAECSTSELTPHLGAVAGMPLECRRHDTGTAANDKRIVRLKLRLDALFLHAREIAVRPAWPPWFPG